MSTVEYVILEPQAPGYVFSTGPKSVAGKARSSMNALKRGLRSKKIVLPSESSADFDEFRQALVDDLRPGGVEETVLADKIAGLHWRMLRMDRAEVDLLSAPLPAVYEEGERTDWDKKAHMTAAPRLVRKEGPPSLAEAIQLRGKDLALILRYRGETRRELAQVRAEYRKLQTERKAREEAAAEFKRKAELPGTPEFLKAMRLKDIEEARQDKEYYEEFKAKGEPGADVFKPPLWTYAPTWVDPEEAMSMEETLAGQRERLRKSAAEKVAEGVITQEQADEMMAALAAQQMAMRESGY